MLNNTRRDKEKMAAEATERADRIAAAVRAEVRQCVNAAQEIVERLRERADCASDVRIVKVQR